MLSTSSHQCTARHSCRYARAGDDDDDDDGNGDDDDDGGGDGGGGITDLEVTI